MTKNLTSSIIYLEMHNGIWSKEQRFLAIWRHISGDLENKRERSRMWWQKIENTKKKYIKLYTYSKYMPTRAVISCCRCLIYIQKDRNFWICHFFWAVLFGDFSLENLHTHFNNIFSSSIPNGMWNMTKKKPKYSTIKTMMIQNMSKKRNMFISWAQPLNKYNNFLYSFSTWKFFGQRK